MVLSVPAVTPRSAWGASPWGTTPLTVPRPERTDLVVHYHGAGSPPAGAEMCQLVERIHMRERGWAGVGYAFLVDRHGAAYEGRGWDLQGAHCTGHNRSGVGIYVGVGGDEQPPQAALRTVRALYDAATHHFGRRLRATWHGALYPTACPGPHLTAWVRAGMPLDMEDDVLTSDEIADRVWADPVPTGERGSDGQPLTMQWLLLRLASTVDRLTTQVAQLRDDVASLSERQD